MLVIRDPVCVFRAASEQEAMRVYEAIENAGFPAAVDTELPPDLLVDDGDEESEPHQLTYTVLTNSWDAAAACAHVEALGLVTSHELRPAPPKSWQRTAGRLMAVGGVAFFAIWFVAVVIMLLFY